VPGANPEIYDRTPMNRIRWMVAIHGIFKRLEAEESEKSNG
jgi:hypothetical protein